MKHTSLILVALVAITSSLSGCSTMVAVPIAMAANIAAVTGLSKVARNEHGAKCAKIVRENRARGISDDDTYQVLVTEKCING